MLEESDTDPEFAKQYGKGLAKGQSLESVLANAVVDEHRLSLHHEKMFDSVSAAEYYFEYLLHAKMPKNCLPRMFDTDVALQKLVDESIALRGKKKITTDVFADD